MRMLWVLPIVGLISGCMTAGGLTSDQTAELRSVHDESKALVDAHKITHVEAATRYNDALEKMLGGRLTQDDRLIMSYRTLLASQIDAGKITQEEANFQFEERKSEILAQEQQQRTNNAIAAAAILSSMPQPQPYVLPQPQVYISPPNNCTSTAFGNMVNTSCN
jgi:hypothetical protein